MTTPKILLTLQWLEQSMPEQQGFTLSQIHDAMPLAAAHYNEPLLPKKLKILTKHGFTPEQWEEIILNSHPLLFNPSEAACICNKEITEYFRRHEHINGTSIYMNYTSQLIRQMVRKNKFTATPYKYTKTGKPYYKYSITK